MQKSKPKSLIEIVLYLYPISENSIRNKFEIFLRLGLFFGPTYLQFSFLLKSKTEKAGRVSSQKTEKKIEFKTLKEERNLKIIQKSLE